MGKVKRRWKMTEPDGKYLCNHFSLKCRKRDIIQDVRRSDRLKTKPSISYKDRNLEINNYNVLNIQTLSEKNPSCYQDIFNSKKLN